MKEVVNDFDNHSDIKQQRHTGALRRTQAHYQAEEMKISNEGIDITKRFFEAIDMLKAQGRIRGLQTFTNEYDINRWNLNKVKANPDTSFLKTEWIYYLCKNYNISAEWIILGTGGMLKQGQHEAEPSPCEQNNIDNLIGKSCTVYYKTPKQQRVVSGIVSRIKRSGDEEILFIVRPNKVIAKIDVQTIVSIEQKP